MKKLFSLFVPLMALFLTLAPQTARAQINEYLYVDGSATINIYVTGTIASEDFPDLWYSTDKSSWTQITGTTSWSPSSNSKTYFKGNNPNGFNHSSSNFVSIAITGGNPSLKGNIMSLIDPTNFASATTIPCDYCFYGLFCPNPPSSFSTSGTYHSTSSSASLYHAKDMVLPATELKPYCYAYMFAYNTGLYDSPVLPALVMQPYCYAHMFEYCMNNFCSQTAYNSGTRLPELPSQQLAEGCYAFMFNMCPNIYNGENDWYCLPAEELVPYCYDGMFGTYRNSYYRSFKSLEIMATSLQDRCGNDITNCMRRMLNYNPMNQTAGQYGRGALNTRMYWTDWGNTGVATAPTYGWFTGFLYSNCTFNYQSGLTPLTKVAKTNYSNTTMSSLFPYSCTLVENNFTYLTFDCKTNGGTWEDGCAYNTDLRRVVRAGYTAKTVPANPHKLGCNFLGWYTAPSGGTKVDNATILSQTTAQTYYAQFIPNDVDYTITIANGAHGHVVVSRNNEPTATYTATTSVHNMSELTITAVPDAGYRFKAWTGDAATIKTAEDNGTTYYLVNDITVGATFEADECTVTINTPAEYGTLAASDGVNNYASGNTYTFNRQLDLNKVLTFTATPAIHRLFTGFTGTELSNVTAAPYVYDQVVTGTYTITADTPDEVTVSATFTVPEFTITTSITGKNGGYVALTADGYADRTGSGTYDIDAVVTLTATPTNEMFKFVRWTDNDSDNPVRTYTVLGDASFEAEFDLDGDLWSAPATVDVYANGYTLKGGTNVMPTSATSTNFRILYNLDPVVGNDGITYTPVDMGAGVAWADRNIGAANVTDAGSYFYWGGIIPYGQTGYTTVSSSNYYTGVTDVTANTSSTATTDANQFPAAADAAKTIMGSQWRTPNIVEMNNLITSTYTTVSTTTGPYTYTNKYYPDDKIQIPLAGRYATSLAKGTANLWTSTLAYKNGASSKPWCYYNNKVYGNTNSTGYSLAYYALPVRAVYVPSFETCTLTVIVYWASTVKYYYKYICEVGQTVTIKQHPNYTKYVFGAWRENTYSGTSLSTDNSYTVTLTGDQTIAAHYVSNNSATILLTLNAVPTKGGTADGGGYYVNGTNVTLTANPNENYRFVRWSDGNTTNPRAYTTTASAVTLTAEFEYTGTASSADANEEVFAYMPTNCFKVLYDHPASMTGNDGITYRLVDMGNGVLWANKNVGAADSTKAGSYFYWGGTTPVTTVGTATTWAGAQDMLLTTSYTTYSTLSPKVVQYALPADNDAATVKMGERWRMPTYEEVYYLSAPTGASETGAAASGYTYANTLSGEKLFIPNSGYYKTNNSSTITTNHSLFWASTMGTFNATNSSCVAGYYYDGNSSPNSNTYGYIWYALPVRGVYVPPFETCTIKVQISGGAVIAGNTSATTYYRYYICEKGQKLRITAHPHSVGSEAWKYAFTNWTDVTNGNAVLSTDPTYEFVVSEDKEIKATFASTTSGFSIIHATPLPRSGGYVYGTGRYKTGVTTQLHAVPEEGYTFVKWEDNNSTDPYREITVSGNASYNAVFTRAGSEPASAHKYVNVFGNNTTTSATAVPLYDGSPLEKCTLTVKIYATTTAKETYTYYCEKGQKVTVSAYSNYNNTTYSLLHWTNTDYDIFSYDPTVELEVSRDMTVYATFNSLQITKRTLTAGVTQTVGGTIVGAGTYDDGQVTKVEATPNAGYRFKYWDDDHENTDPRRILSVNADATYTAVFEEDYDPSAVVSAHKYVNVYQTGTNKGVYNIEYDGAAPAEVCTLTINSTSSHPYYFVCEKGQQISVSAYPQDTSSYRIEKWVFHTTANDVATTVQMSTDQTYDILALGDATYTVTYTNGTLNTKKKITLVSNIVDACQFHGTGVYTPGQQAKIICEPNPHYHFLYWDDDHSLTNPERIIIVNADMTYKAVLEVDDDLPEVTSAHKFVNVYQAGTDKGTFVMYDGTTPAQTCTLTVKTMNGTIANEYKYICEVGQRLTVSAFNAAPNTTGVEKCVYNNLTNLSIAAAPTYSTDQTIEFLALSDKTYTITYAAPSTTRTITLTANPVEGATFEPVVNTMTYTFVSVYNNGQYAKLICHPKPGYNFLYWDDDHTLTDTIRYVTVNANATYTAVLEMTADLSGVKSEEAFASVYQGGTNAGTYLRYYLPESENGYRPVDIGTGIAWANKNVNATDSTDAGSYFYWGGITPVTTASSGTWWSGVTSMTTTTNNTVVQNALPASNDAAATIMKGQWRMPTYAELYNLQQHPGSNQTGQASAGYQWINKEDASKNIFIPAGGYYTSASLTTGNSAIWGSTTNTISNGSTRPAYWQNSSASTGATTHYAWHALPVRAVYQPVFETCSVTVVVKDGTSTKGTYYYICEKGQRLTINAVATAGATSSHAATWVDQNNVTVCTDQTYSLIALSDVTLTVTFNTTFTTARTLTFNVSPANSGTVNNAATYTARYNQGTQAMATAKPAQYYKFAYWDDDHENTNPNRVFTVPNANTTYTAVFEPDLSQAVNAQIAQAATADTMKILYPLPVTAVGNIFYTPIDMGYGVAWANRNVGSPTEDNTTASFCFWGGGTAKTSFRQYNTAGTYFYSLMSSTNAEADFTSNATYDLAYNVMGSNWRVPTKSQWDALLANTDIVNYTYTNKTEADKHIFLPALGAYVAGTSATTTKSNTTHRYYWTRTLKEKNSTSTTLYKSLPYVYYDGEIKYGNDVPTYGYACYGMPVRAVYEPSFTPDTVRLRYVNEEDEVTYTNTYLVQPGQPVCITAVPKEGYIFTLWSDGDTHASRSFISSGNVTLTAEFQEESSSTSIVNVVSDDVTMGTVSGGGEVERNSEVTITATPVAHYHFVKWQKDDEDIEGNASLTFTADFVSANFKAFFAIDRHTLTTTGANGTITGGGEYDYGTTGITLTATANAHYHFVKWQKDGVDIEGGTSITVDVTADATYNAVFAIDRHTLSVTATNGTAIGAGEYDYGTEVTLNVTPDEHYHFVSWSDDGAQSHSVTVTADAEYTATCSIDRFTLTVNGSNATVTGAGEYDYNTQVTVTVSPDMGYNFVRWTDGETNPSRIVTMTENKTLAYETVYVPSYAITTVANGGVIYQTADRYEQQNGPTTYSYMNGTVLTLEVAASFGYAFTGWSDGNSDNPRVVTVTEAKTYTAQFSEQTNIVFHQTTGVLDFPTYAKNTFAIIGETDDVTFRLYFNTTLTTNKTDYLANLSLDASQSYIQPTVGAKRTIASATVANVTYAGETFRAAHLTAMLTDTEGRTYDVDIYTNYCINYATFQNDYTYRYYQSYLPTESSWVTGRSFQYNENNHLSGMGIPSLVHTNVLRFFYMTSSPFNECNIWLQFNPLTEGTGNIPTGVYPINSTGLPGTVYVGSIPTGSYPQFARETSTPALYTNTGSWVFHGFENEYGAPVYNNWTLRGGYVEVVNVDEQYYVHVHAYTDGYKTLGEQDNTVIDFTAGAVSATTAISISAQTVGGEALTDAVTATLAGASNWTDVEIGQGSHTFFSGNTLNLTAAKPGYLFDHWEVNGIPVAGEDFTYAYTVGAADAAIVAVFELDTRPFYTIAAETSGRGTATLTADGYKPQTGSGYYAENTNVTMSVAAGTGATFLGWDDNNDGTVDNTQNPRTVTATSDKTYTAVFGLESADQAVNVYQAAAADTMKILYNLDAKTGLDGKTYFPVDLGYGVAWADRNVGANQPTDVGSYFYWGDTEGHTSFNAYQALNTSSYTSGTTLTPDLDAATQQIGTAWRMPTDDEWLDLRKNTTQSADHGTFMNKTYAGNTIYLPASGFYGTTYRNLYLYGDEGPWTSKLFTNYRFYWSSVYFVQNASNGLAFPYTFEDAEADANNYYYVNTNVTLNSTSYGFFDCFGMPVRAIYEPEYPTYTLTINVGTKQYKYICQAGQNITVTANATVEGYVFDKWTEDDNTNATRTFNVTGNMSFTATFKEAPSTPVYDITIETDGTGYGTVDVSAVNDVEEGTAITVSDNTLTINGTTVTATPAANTEAYKYKFTGWTDNEGNTLPATITADLTVRANFAREMHLVLCENCENEHYNDFLSFDGMTANTVTLNRQFTQGRWATLCLPFNVNNGTLRTMSMLGRVYEFSKATGSATIIEGQNNGITLYFSNATSLVAGKCYIVNANASLAKKTSFMFSNVTIDLTEDKVANLDGASAYNGLTGYKKDGTISLVGTLRKGTLIGTGTGNTYMGLKDNMIYYPNPDQGNIILAYRGLFRSSTALNAERIRIIVDGEDMGELRIDKGKMLIDNSAEPRKFIENGVLYIERNGVIYDATGKRVELDK